jgi:hypothetical protein
MPVTAKYALRYPAPADPADVPTDMGELAVDVEAALTGTSLVGTYAARPAATAVKAGTVYYATDALGTFRSDGTAWTLVAQGAPAITPAQMSAAPWSTPYDGMRIRLVADAASGAEWELAYRAASGNGEKWEFLGGSPLTAFEATAVGIPPDAHSNFGPVVYTPRAGVYFIEARNTFGAGGGRTGYLQPNAAGSAAVGPPVYVPMAVDRGTAVFSGGAGFVAAGVQVSTGLYASGGANSTDRLVSIVPVRLA